MVIDEKTFLWSRMEQIDFWRKKKKKVFFSVEDGLSLRLQLLFFSRRRWVSREGGEFREESSDSFQYQSTPTLLLLLPSLVSAPSATELSFSLLLSGKKNRKQNSTRKTDR